MADQVPIRAGLSGASLTGLAIFASGETIGVAHGGTGLATVGANQLLTGHNSSTTGALTSESNLTFDGTILKATGDLCATVKVVSPALCIGSEYVLPTSDGSAGQIMCTDGSGALAFATVSGSGADPTSTNTWTADQTLNDNVKITLGTGGDADIYYNATDLVINPRVAGNGSVAIGDGTQDIGGDIGTAQMGLTIYNSSDTGGVDMFSILELANNNTVNGGHVGMVKFARNKATTKSVAQILVTSDSAHADAGAHMRFFTKPSEGSNAERMRITSAGKLGIGLTNPTQVLDVNGSAHVANILYANESANANMTVGATFNQGSNDNEILAFKSSDVAQSVTDVAEADTYGTMQKSYGDYGGLKIRGLVGGDAQGQALLLEGITSHASPQSAKGTANNAIIILAGYKASGSAKGNLAANENVVAITGASGHTKFIFDADGDSHQDVGTAWTNFDDHDDVALTRSLGIALDPASIVQTKWDDWGKDHFREMEDFGLIGKIGDEDKAKGERGLVNMTLLAKLHNGAIGQLGAALNDMKEVYQDKIAALEARLMRLEN